MAFFSFKKCDHSWEGTGNGRLFNPFGHKCSKCGKSGTCDEKYIPSYNASPYDDSSCYVYCSICRRLMRGTTRKDFK